MFPLLLSTILAHRASRSLPVMPISTKPILERNCFCRCCCLRLASAVVASAAVAGAFAVAFLLSLPERDLLLLLPLLLLLLLLRLLLLRLPMPLFFFVIPGGDLLLPLPVCHSDPELAEGKEPRLCFCFQGTPRLQP
jgi:hypothetical protein